mmetsp:Transcript_10033/g.13148  ORF Transcript_10033/g.13148 Transcript_10033/m.13148 type:complete len:128 (+) Transcript_10033:21-404(+)
MAMATSLFRGSPMRSLISQNRSFGSKRAAQGLYGGKDIGFGNNVSHSERKTRRSWKPNVQSKKLWSETLDEFVHFRVTTHALRCIDKAGGLDNYLLKNSSEKLNSISGDLVKERILEIKLKNNEVQM